ncbi:hypothetical protein ACGFY0_45345 [Streptomyces chartreusis]|uniref:hypothetical protein n=1 Tax=Streptomyces chartreusis TaxID=1969 RepID=UPI00371AECD7
MRVRMKASLSGTRDGLAWPPAGQTVDLPEEEAAHLVSAGLAAEDQGNGTAPAEETATPPDEAETAVPARRRTQGKKPSSQ